MIKLFNLTKLLFALRQFEHIYRVSVCEVYSTENTNCVSELPPHPRGAPLLCVTLLSLPTIHVRARGPGIRRFWGSVRKCVFSGRD